MRTSLIIALFCLLIFGRSLSFAGPEPKQEEEPAAEQKEQEAEKKKDGEAKEKQKAKAKARDDFAIDLNLQPQVVEIEGGRIQFFGAQVRIAAAEKKASGEEEEEKEGEDKPDEDATTEDKIAAFMKKREVDARKPRAEQMQRRIDELEQIVGISEKQKKKLEIASKGAIEKSLEPWREQMDNYVRQYLQRAPQDVDMVLASIGNVNFGQTAQQQAAEQEIWQATIAKVLDEKQMATYQQTIDERNDYLYSAVAELLVADLDRSLRLTREQREALKGLLIPVVEQNLIYLGRWSNDGNLPVYQLPALLGGVKEKDLKENLSDKQIDGWKNRYGNFKGMWDAVQRQKESQEEESKE